MGVDQSHSERHGGSINWTCSHQRRILCTHHCRLLSRRKPMATRVADAAQVKPTMAYAVTLLLLMFLRSKDPYTAGEFLLRNMTFISS